jgi:hypothetical protein
MAIKGENQIYADIVGFVNSSLSALDIQGWQVLQLKQPVKLTDITPTVYVTCTLRRRRGWQYRDYKIIDAELKNTQYFKQEIDVQFSALRRRDIDDTVDTLNSADVLEYLKTYMLNPYTLQDLRALGYEIYQPSEVQNPDFFDDSDNFEFMPFFNVTFILNQSLSSPQMSIDEYTLKIQGV